MRRLVVGELIKVRTTRTAFGFGIVGLLLTIAGVLITTLASDPATLDDKRAALNFGGSIAVLVLIFGVVGAAGEFRHRTVAPAVLIAPDRVRLVIARIGAYALTAGIVAIAVGAVVFVLGILLLVGSTGPDLDGGDYASIAAGGLLAAVLCAILGVGVGTLVRNQVAAVVALLVWLFVLEPLLVVIDEDWIRYTISTATGALGQGGDSDASMLTAALVLAAWAAALSITGTLVDQRRDVE